MDEKYVAFIDILGFKFKLKRFGQNRTEEFIREFLGVVDELWESYPNLEGTLVSDSLVINCGTHQEGALGQLIMFMEALFRKAFSEKSILLRGAIAKGKFQTITSGQSNGRLNKNVFVGQAYVDAYLLESASKAVCINITQDVYDDCKNEGLVADDLMEVKIQDKTCYLIRPLNAVFLTRREILECFVREATEASWLPHYYNTLAYAVKRETKDSMMESLFEELFEIVYAKPITKSWRNTDTFISNFFQADVDQDFRTRFLRFLRGKIDTSQTMNKSEAED